MTTPATAMSVLDDTLTVATYLLSPKGRAHYKSLFDFSPRLKPGDSSFTDWCWLSPARGCASLT